MTDISHACRLSSAASEIKPSSLDVAMGRKGGGKKAFLKGVVTKPDGDNGAAEGSTESEVPSPQPSTSETASERPDTSSAGPQVPDVRPTTEDLSSETRGQLTQRHKKVKSPCCLERNTAFS